MYQPVSAIGLKDVDFGLFCIWNDIDKPGFLDRVSEGKFDVLFPSIGSWNADNTLSLAPASRINTFISEVKSVNPNIKVIAWFSSYPPDVKPNLSTPELRQKCINEVKNLVNYADWDGILDDTEKYIGTKADQFQYFTSCANVIESMDVVYYPWMWYKDLLYVDSQRAAVGAYGTYSFYETEWKNALDLSQDTASVAFSWHLIVDHYQDKPTLRQQLEFLDEKVLERGISYYSKMDILGLYTYHTMEEDDWDAWNTWISQTPLPTPSASPLPTPSASPLPTPSASPLPTPISPTDQDDSLSFHSANHKLREYERYGHYIRYIRY